MHELSFSHGVTALADPTSRIFQVDTHCAQAPGNGERWERIGIGIHCSD